MTTNIFEKGKHIFIEGVTYTSRAVGLDSKGTMRKMVGHHYPIKSVGSRMIGIIDPTPGKTFTFSWDKKDLSPPRKLKEVKPMIVNFDTKHLDV